MKSVFLKSQYAKLIFIGENTDVGHDLCWCLPFPEILVVLAVNTKSKRMT